jgi:predicted DCC family thiol-disulfide oxidoreductase YuxK
MTSASSEHPVVLFDGVCNLCNASVNFVIDRDPEGIFHFAPLQSSAGRALLASHGRVPPEGEPDSIVLVENGLVYDRSTAALRVARRLRGPVKLLYALIVFPRVVRDLVYRLIARNRYRWFGKSDVCRVPTPELKARFLG